MNGAEFFSGNFVLLKSVEIFFTFQSTVHKLKVTGNRCFGVWPEHGYFN